MLRQSWDTLNRPKQMNLPWGVKQTEVLDTVRQGYSYDDEELRRIARRFLYVLGKPGSGKSAALLQCAILAGLSG